MADFWYSLVYGDREEAMFRALILIFAVVFLTTTTFAQQKFTEKTNDFDEVIETNNPDFDNYAAIDGLGIEPVKWVPYISECKQCQSVANKYNAAMQELFNVRGLLGYWENMRDVAEEREKNAKIARDAVDAVNSTLDNITVLEPEPLSEEEAARELSAGLALGEIYENQIPRLREAKNKLELTAKNLRRSLTECEALCVPLEDRKSAISLPSTEIIQDPALPFDWSGPYYEVCESCRKLAERLNELYDIGIENVNELNTVNARLTYLDAELFALKLKEPATDGDKKKHVRRLKQIQRDIKNSKKDQKRILKNQDKIIKNFNDTLAKYNECIKSCPPQKKACVFPDELFSSMNLGPNNEVGSSAQAAKEMRDRVSGAAKGAATKAIGSLLGIGGFGGGGSSGPKTDRDRSRGDFTRLSSGDTDLDVRASWRKDQLIVSTEIDDSPDNGTFHAQWLEDKEGNIYLPVRYLIFKMYRDWKLTVSWTEDHYVDGKNVFHDEGQEISTGRDHLGTWSLFEGDNAATNSIWGMLGFDTAAKGVKHIGAVYDIPMSSFPDDCQMQLVTHISEPSKDPVTSLPIVGDLFKHVDESRRKPETIILIQPHIIEERE